MPSCSWLLAPRSQVVPNEPDSKTCAFLRGRPVRTCLVNGVFAGRVVGRISLPRRRSCLVGAWRDADFAVIALTTKPRQSVVPRTNLVKFVGVAGAGSESGLPPSFSTAVACVRARLESLEVQRGRTKVAPDPIYNNNSMRLVLYSRPSSQTLTVLLMLFNRNRSANSIAVHGVVFVSNP